MTIEAHATLELRKLYSNIEKYVALYKRQIVDKIILLNKLNTGGDEYDLKSKVSKLKNKHDLQVKAIKHLEKHFKDLDDLLEVVSKEQTGPEFKEVHIAYDHLIEIAELIRSQLKKIKKISAKKEIIIDKLVTDPTNDKYRNKLNVKLRAELISLLKFLNQLKKDLMKVKQVLQFEKKKLSPATRKLHKQALEHSINNMTDAHKEAIQDHSLYPALKAMVYNSIGSAGAFGISAGIFLAYSPRNAPINYTLVVGSTLILSGMVALMINELTSEDMITNVRRFDENLAKKLRMVKI